MDSRIKRAKMIDQFMTIVFYGIALFFFLLLVGFAGKVIIGGLLGAKPEMFGFTRSGSIGNQLSIYFFVGFGSNWSISRHLFGNVRKTWACNTLFKNLY